MVPTETPTESPTKTPLALSPPKAPLKGGRRLNGRLSGSAVAPFARDTFTELIPVQSFPAMSNVDLGNSVTSVYLLSFLLFDSGSTGGLTILQ